MEARDVALRPSTEKTEVAPEKEYLNAHGKTAAIILCLLILAAWVYAPVLTQKYGWNDDYPLLVRVTNGSFHYLDNEYMEVGRPLLGFGTKFLFSIPNSLDELREARIVSVVGVLIFALAAFGSLRKLGFDRGFSLTVALLACLTPGFAVYAGWLTEGLDTYAAAFAIVAGSLFVTTLEEPRFADRLLPFSLGVAFLLCSYATYQPTAGFAVLPLLANAWRDFKIDAGRARTFFFGIALILSVAAFYFVAYKIVALACHYQGLASRAQISKNILGNIWFVMTRVFWSGLTGWAQLNAPWVQCVVGAIMAVIILGGCAASPWNSFRAQLPGLACVTGALFIAVLPLLIVKEQIFAFRTQTALHAVVGLIFIIGVKHWCRGIFRTVAERWTNFVFAGILCMAAGVTRLHLNRDFVRYNVHEVEVLTKGLEQLQTFPTNMVFTTPPQLMQRKDGVVAEFRYPTSPWVWSAPAMLELLLIKLHENHVPLRVALERHEGFKVRYGPANPDGLPLLDGFALFAKGPLQDVNDPYWGKIRVAQNGWCLSDWFGVFDNDNFPSVYQCQLGWLYCQGKGGDDIWLSSGNYGWLWTNPKSFPAMLVKRSETWFWLSPEIQDPLFINLKDKSSTLNP